MIGTVKFFDRKRGFGFIAPDGKAEGVFVHIEGVEYEARESIDAGQRVRFEVANTPRGLRAQHVRPVDGDTEP